MSEQPKPSTRPESGLDLVARVLRANENARLRKRVAHLEDVVERLLAELTARQGPKGEA